ncbi:PKD domain-containing protein [Pseudoalteromonas sp. Of7M-16]|uniref:PKD domain-containing protein n=1 Tax=Pseudoalteromonas sp. Of7M-16 TaxID=2917756 RepID=UPI001EF47DD3|nr:PKD domain-containing protein [Pseudoalteromonas sp. Of7M-16]MCG7551030.1 PKD domain-containing protein [Pseudoalteromonas sp. Of7M-16]
MNKLLPILLFMFAAHLSAAQLDYFWDFGDGTISNLAEPEHQYKAAGIYTVKREVYQNGILVMKSEQVVDLVTPKIVALEIALPSQIIAKQGTEISALLTTSEPIEMLKYQWFLDEESLGDAVQEAALEYVFERSGKHMLKLHALWGATIVKSTEIELEVVQESDNIEPGDGTDPDDGNKGTDPDDGNSVTPPDNGNKVPDNSDKSPNHGEGDSGGGGSLGIVSLFWLLCLIRRRRK